MPVTSEHPPSNFSFARKPPITPKPLYQAINCKPSHSKDQFLKTNSKKKPGPFDIDSIIGNRNANLKKCDLKIDDHVILLDNENDVSGTNEILDANSSKDTVDGITLYPGVTIDMTKANKEDNQKTENMSETRDNNYLINNATANFSYLNYAYIDRSAEVKHAQTPIYTTSHQTYSPQLPIPSPNYPVQTKLSTDYTCMDPCSTEVSEKLNNSNINETSNLISSKLVSIIKVPKVKRTNESTSFWDLHLPLSNVPMAENQKFLSNITIKNLLEKNASDINKGTAHEFKECVVLNIPNVNNHHHHHPPPTKKPKLSKMDISVQKRRRRKAQRQIEENNSNKENETRSRNIKEERVVFERITTHRGTVTNYGVHVFGYSDSSSSSLYNSSESESDTGEMEVLEKFNESDKLSVTPEKVKFFNIFGLATQRKRNEIEFSKIERRKWRSRLVYPAIQKSEIKSLNLPVPSDSPSVLNTTPDYNLKSNYLHILGLRRLSPNESDEYEKIWLQIVKDRIKRNCESAVTKYSLKVCTINKPNIKMDKSSSKDKIENCLIYAQSNFNQNEEIFKCSKELTNKSDLKMYNTFLERNCVDSSINVVKYISVSNEALKNVGKSDISIFPANKCVNFMSTTEKIDFQWKNNEDGETEFKEKALEEALRLPNIPEDKTEAFFKFQENRDIIKIPPPPKSANKTTGKNFNPEKDKVSCLKVISKEVLQNWASKNVEDEKFFHFLDKNKESRNNKRPLSLKIITTEVLKKWKAKNMANGGKKKRDEIGKISILEPISNEIEQNRKAINVKNKKLEGNVLPNFCETRFENDKVSILKEENLKKWNTKTHQHGEKENFEIDKSLRTGRESEHFSLVTLGTNWEAKNEKTSVIENSHTKNSETKDFTKLLLNQIADLQNLRMGNETPLKVEINSDTVFENYNSIEYLENNKISTSLFDEIFQGDIEDPENTELSNKAIKHWKSRIIEQGISSTLLKAETNELLTIKESSQNLKVNDSEIESCRTSETFQDCNTKTNTDENEKLPASTVIQNYILRNVETDKCSILETNANFDKINEKYTMPSVITEISKNHKTINGEAENFSSPSVITNQTLQNSKVDSANTRILTPVIVSNKSLQKKKNSEASEDCIIIDSDEDEAFFVTKKSIDADNDLLKLSSDKAISPLLEKKYKSNFTQTEMVDTPCSMILLDNQALKNDNELFCTIKEIKSKKSTAHKKIQCMIKEGMVDKRVQCSKFTAVNSASFKCLNGDDSDVQQWTGMHKLLELCQAYIKECDSKIEALTKALTNLKQETLSKQTESKYLERKLLALQSASYLFEKERMQLKKAIDHLTKTINAFR